MLNDKIQELIVSDDSFNANQDQIIRKSYETATLEEKQKIDEIFIALTGYSLSTILE